MLSWILLKFTQCEYTGVINGSYILFPALGTHANKFEIKQVLNCCLLQLSELNMSGKWQAPTPHVPKDGCVHFCFFPAEFKGVILNI